MKREFRTGYVKKLRRDVGAVLSGLEYISNASAELEEKINVSARLLIAEESLDILRNIPVEELNRDRKGIRTGLLRKSGFENIADICEASVYRIDSVYGISPDASSLIKKTAESMRRKAEKEAKISLSSDNRGKAASELVVSVSGYKNYLPIKKETDGLLEKYAERIRILSHDAGRAGSAFRWLFSSKAKKQRAAGACRELDGIYNAGISEKSKELGIKYLEAVNVSENNAWLDFEKNSIIFYNILERLNPGAVGTDDSFYGLPEFLAEGVGNEEILTDGLLCTLRKYQEWGVKYILHQKRVLLGDEMGLGKTVQAIAVMVTLRNRGASHFLVVCPAGIIINWCREISKHSDLKVIKVHGEGRTEAVREWISSGGVAVTTYETAFCFRLQKEFRFSMLVLDEAHYIKNPKAKRTHVSVGISAHADRLLFMTGTPLENNVDEMLGLIGILQPDVARAAGRLSFMVSAPQFREKISPVYYRRKRDEVLKELPELQETEEWCRMMPQEEAVYENAVLEKRFSDCRRVSWNVPDLKYSSKAERLLEIVRDAELENRKVLVFSFFLDTIRKISTVLGGKCTEPVTGSVPPARRQEIIDDFEKSEERNVLVAQIQAGGTGLNIQCASVVVICEPQFKPSSENQAVSRAYRMGQARNVLVFRLLCEDTVDERLTDLLRKKQKIFDAFADESEAAKKTVEVDGSEFGKIIESEIDRIKRKRGETGKVSEGKKDTA